MKFTPVQTKARQELDMRPGDTVRVQQKIQEKDKTRLQAFEGMVIARKHGTEPGATFTVRRSTNGYGVEKVFPLYSPMIDSIEITKRSKTRRSKLYFIREKALKQASKRLKMMFVDIKTEDMPDAPEVEEVTEEVAPETVDAPATEEAPVEEKVEETPAEEPKEEAPVVEEVKEEAPAEADDLTKIEGIGPKIAEVLTSNNITTFAALAEVKDEDTQEMIKDVKGNHQAGTWNEQAALARDGKWDELKDLQDKLDGGVEK